MAFALIGTTLHRLANGAIVQLGFEPTRTEVPDLKSAPNHSGKDAYSLQFSLFSIINIKLLLKLKGYAKDSNPETTVRSQTRYPLRQRASLITLLFNLYYFQGNSKNEFLMSCCILSSKWLRGVRTYDLGCSRTL